MACMASESSASAVADPSVVVGSGGNIKKRCSLPGPMGSLNLYTTHQQRRLSERGLMVYRPSKPDIDLIGDFINPNKKSMTNSTSPSKSALSSSPPQSTAIFTTSNNLPPTTVNILPTITSPSRSPSDHTCKSISRGSCGSLGNGPLIASSRIPPGGSSRTITASPPTTTMVMSTASTCPSATAVAGSTTQGCRKVRIRIQKSPGGKENKFVEMQTIPTGSTTRSASVSLEREDSDMLLHHPKFDSRRFSDSVTCAPPKISISLTADGSDAGIICSTGDLRALKCLTSSAQEIRFYSNPGSRDMSMSREGENGSTSPDPHGNRSRSFDATSTVVTSRRKGIGSSWFNRRHVPISAKLPMPLKSPSVPNSPGPHQLTLKAPILTVTNETSGQSELIEVPSPPASTPTSGDISDDKTKVTWDQSGFQVDAAVLGSVIENHLRKTDMRRRATVSTLYEPNAYADCLQSPSRARSASACVIPNIGLEGCDPIFGSRSGQPHTVTFLSTLSTGPGCNSTSPRRSSLKTSMAPGNSCRNSGLGGRLSFQASATGEGEAMTIRKHKRFSLSGPSSFGQGYSPMIPSLPVKGHDLGRKNSGQSFVETVDESSGKVKTTTKSSYSAPYTYVIPPINGRISTEDEEEEESRRRTAYYKKVNSQGQHSGLSICSAIRDFIIHSLKS